MTGAAPTAARRPTRTSRRELLRLVLAGAAGGLALGPTHREAVAAGAPGAQQPPAQVPRPGPTDALDEQVPGWLARYRVPGAAVAVVSQGNVTATRAYGLADEAHGVPVTPATVFQLASVSKPVSAWGVMKLVQDGRLALDAPVERYLTRWHLPSSPFATAGATVRRVLSHTAGLSLGGYLGFAPGEPLPTLEASLDGMTEVGSDAPEDFGPVHLVQPPGRGFRYSGGGYTLLQLLVEEVSGRPFAAYMRDEVFRPLGMSTSSFEWDPPLRAAAATGYDTDEQPLPDYRFTELAAAGLNSTAGGLARWVAAAVVGPQGEPPGRGVLAPTTLSQMFAQQSAATVAPNSVFGLGYLLSQEPGGPLWAEHTGGNRGWRTYFGVRPDERAGIVVLTNGDNGLPVFISVVRAWGESTGVGWSPALPEPGQLP